MEKRFWIATDNRHPHGDMIYALDNGLHVGVYLLNETSYTPASNEVQLYACTGNDILLFETVDIQPDDALDMLSAVRCYLEYIGISHAPLFTSEPVGTARAIAEQWQVNGAIPSSILHLLN